MTTDARPALTPADHAFALFCEQGALALAMFAALSGAQPVQAQRIASGYEPKATRNAVAHGMYKLGARVPRRRVPAAQARVTREAAILYGVAS